jgi:hypothetical protein
LGTNEFAEEFRKNGAYCRVDVGIDPYELPGRLIPALSDINKSL